MAKINSHAIAPTGNGSTTEWTASSGEAYNCVDALTACYGDSYYITTGTFNNEHLFTTPSSGYPSEAIGGVTLFARLKDASVTDHGVNLGFLIGGTTYWGDAKVVNSTSEYIEIRQRWVLNPDTSNVWTWNDIESLEFGIKAVRIAGGAYDADPRCSQLQLIVWCDD